jgi:hypothetical protein
MKYLKSVLAGIAALHLALVLVPIALLLVAVVYFLLLVAKESQTNGTVGWDPVSLRHQVPVIGLLLGWTPLIALALLVFSAGFYWQFRRDSRKVTVC